jgi:hypothetical protein
VASATAGSVTAASCAAGWEGDTGGGATQAATSNTAIKIKYLGFNIAVFLV